MTCMTTRCPLMWSLRYPFAGNHRVARTGEEAIDIASHILPVGEISLHIEVHRNEEPVSLLERYQLPQIRLP